MFAAQVGIDPASYVSIALLLVVVGAAWRLSAQLSKIEAKLELLESVPSRLRHLENHAMTQEEDLNNLFAAALRGSDGQGFATSLVRRSKFKPFSED